MSLPLAYTQPIPETLLEIFDTIHQFTTSADFAIWLTDGQLNHEVYENRVEEGKHKRTYQYDYKGHIFFQGKIEIDLSYYPVKSIGAITSKSLFSVENPAFAKVGKTCVSRVFAEPYYTIISHSLYKTKIAGMVWEIYNLNSILTLYKIKKRSS